MATIPNRCWFNVAAAPGTGSVSVGTATSGYRTLTAADDGLTFDGVTLLDGSAWEIRNGCVYTHGTTTLTRGTLEESSTGSAISLSASTTVMMAMSASWLTSINRLLSHGAARAKGSGSNQTISSLSTFTRLTCLTEEFDGAGYWDDTLKVYKPTLAGRYLLVGQASISGIDSGKRMILRIGVDTAGGSSLSGSNAQSFDLFRGYSSTAGGFVGGAGAAVVVANGTASFGLMVWQDSSITAVVDATANLCNFHAVYLGPTV